MPTDRAVLFVFSHQDDEMAAISGIEEETRNSAVFCIYLTDGAAAGADPAVRNEESLDVLMSAGVSRSRIFFPGAEIPIRDGTLVHHLDQALHHVQRLLAGVHIDSVYCLAWEGGHQDHDASQLVAAAFAKSRQCLDQCFEVPLYRQMIGPFYRVLSPLRSGAPWTRRRLTLRDGLRYSRMTWRFRSQRRSWLGLLPGALLKFVLLRLQDSRPVDITRYGSRPHAGPLFYEGRFRFPYATFESAAAPFIDAHFRR